MRSTHVTWRCSYFEGNRLLLAPSRQGEGTFGRLPRGSRRVAWASRRQPQALLLSPFGAEIKRNDRDHETPQDIFTRIGDTEKRRRTKRMQRDATAVSVVRDGRRVGSFGGRQQLVEGAPLMRMPFCG